MIKKTKKAVSPVVTTVLLICLSVFLITIIARFVIPFVKSSLYESGDCFKTIEQLTINAEKGKGFACYIDDNNNADKVKITIKRGTADIDISRFMIVVSGEGNSDSFTIQEGRVTDVAMLKSDGTENVNLKLPEKGEERTYILSVGNKIDYAEVVPIVKGGKICSVTDSSEIKACS